MNYADSDRLREVLCGVGMREVDDMGEADLVVLNTCNVRQKAADRVFGLRKKVRELKKKRPGVVWGIMGCLVEETSVWGEGKGDLLLRQLKGLDFTLRVEEMGELPVMLGLGEGCGGDYLEIVPEYAGKFTARVPIMTGCDNFCSYCTVPYARGRERSRGVGEVLAECERALQAGVKEIELLGQNVNSYEYGFAELLKKVNDLPGKFWLRFKSSHPKDCSEELFKVMSECEKVCPELHLAVQNGCDRTLARMNRKYTAVEYEKLVELYRKWVPGGALTTDWIVGFCGETEDDFQESLGMIARVRFDQIYLAKYSERAGTLAAREMEDDVSEEEKARRWHRLNDRMVKIAWEQNEVMVGREVEVLVEEGGMGRTAENKIAVVGEGEWKRGEFWRGEVVRARGWQLICELRKKVA